MVVVCVCGLCVWLSRMLSTLMQKCSLLLLPNALPCDVAGMARSDRNTGIAQLILSDLALIFWKGFDLEHVFVRLLVT